MYKKLLQINNKMEQSKKKIGQGHKQKFKTGVEKPINIWEKMYKILNNQECK